MVMMIVMTVMTVMVMMMMMMMMMMTMMMKMMIMIQTDGFRCGNSKCSLKFLTGSKYYHCYFIIIAILIHFTILQGYINTLQVLPLGVMPSRSLAGELKIVLRTGE